MDSTKWKELYKFIETVTLDYFSKEENCAIAEYKGQKLSHHLPCINDILAHARSKKFIDEYRKYMPLHPCAMLEDMLDKMYENGILFEISYQEFTLNRKLASPISKWVSERDENRYLERLNLNNLIPYFDELNKLSLEDKLKHRILFNTLPGKVITQLIDLNIYTYYDLVTTRRYVAYHNIDHIVQTHLHLLNLEFDMYELNGKIKQDKNEKIIKIIDILKKIHTNEIGYDIDLRWFSENIFLFKENNINYLKWLRNGIKLYNLEDYFIFDTLQISNLRNKKDNYRYRDNIYCVQVKDDFPYDNVNILLKLMN